MAACGEGERLALCLHGFPECGYSWRFQLPLLAKLGYLAWAPDLRGYGESERPPRMQDYAIERLLDDVAGLIDASGCRSTLLVGHDWGAIIAWIFATRRVRELERLVIMNGPHPQAAAPAFRSWQQLRRSWYAFFFQLPWLPEKLLGMGGGRVLVEGILRSASRPERFGEDVQALTRAAAARPGALRAMLNYYRAFLRGGGLARQRALGFPPIETPTLLIWGEQDVALTLETIRGTDAFVRDLTVRTLPHSSHWVQQEAPELVNPMLEAWLEGRPVPEARR
ncbi:MAG: alpha/beta hydrolase [Myxococcota bacterium]